MCGIFGYLGKSEASAVCLEGLKKLEYRGYDSSGIAGFMNGKLTVRRELGKVARLEELIKEQPVYFKNAIAHTRWATHGVPSQRNAHPIQDEKQSVAVAHNGIIENYAKLRKSLESEGVNFKTETDTEVISQLIAKNYRGNILQALHETLRMLEGFWAIAVMHQDHPDTILVSARENPLAVGRHRDEMLISSDVGAFGKDDLDVLFLQNDEIAVVTNHSLEIYNSALLPVKRELTKIDTKSAKISKEGYEHFMLKEIFEQATTIFAALDGRVDLDAGVPLLKELKLTDKELLAIDRVILIGCGTSWHAATLTASLLEEKARIPAVAEIASELRYKEDPMINDKTLVIAISQSGETADTLGALEDAKRKRARVIGICNTTQSKMARESTKGGSCLFLNAGPEISVCSTKAFTSQLVALFLLTLHIAKVRGSLSLQKSKKLLDELCQLPRLAREVFALHTQIEEVANNHASFEDFFFLGRQYMYPTSLESALKLKEISYLNATGYPAGEMKHGPIALVCEKLLVIGLCGNLRTLDKTISNLMEVKARSAPILLFAPQSQKEKLEEEFPTAVYLPDVADELAPILYSIATQLFAYYVAKKRGTDIDKPRNLAKSVTVE